MKKLTHHLAALGLALSCSISHAQELRIGSRNDPAVDPHFLWLGTNTAYSKHMFEALVLKDENSALKPGLSERWKMVDDLTWEFRLRRDVKFHDGSPFTAEDVKFSYERARTLPNNPSSYAPNLSSIASIDVVDPHTIRFRTSGPTATLPGLLGNVVIVSHIAAKGALPPDFRSGKAAVGTGAFKFEEYRPGESLSLKRNDAYWGERPAWDKVTFKIIPNDSTRVVALLSGDVDLVEHVPITEASRIAGDPNLRLHKRVSDRAVYLSLDSGRDRPPFLTDKAGNPLQKNPFKDVRVRKAISKGINRSLIAQRLMEGFAQPASQLAPEGLSGYNASLQSEAYDPEGAKKSLADAGWPDGFGLTVHCTSDRIVNDSKICEVIGQMLSRLGLAVKVETMPASIFFSRARLPQPDFSVMLSSWGHSDTTDISPLLISAIHTYDPQRGFGQLNRSLYSNPVLDQRIEDVIKILDLPARQKGIEEVMALVDREVPAVPLHTQFAIVGTKRSIDYRLRRDEQTLAMSATPAN